MAKSKAKSRSAPRFRLTYSTMFDPPEALHTSFERALDRVKADLGRDYPMLIGGRERFTTAKFDDRSPINSDWLLGTFQKGGAQDAQDAIAAARAAFPAWNALWEGALAVHERRLRLETHAASTAAGLDLTWRVLD